MGRLVTRLRWCIQAIVPRTLALQPLLLPPRILLQAAPKLLAEELIAAYEPGQGGPDLRISLALQEGCLQQDSKKDSMATNS